jgi:hypothetical protein
LTVIFAPGDTDAGTWYSKSLIVMTTGCAADAFGAALDDMALAGADDDADCEADDVMAGMAPVVPDADGGCDEPQAVSPRINPVAAMAAGPDVKFMICPF